MGEGSLIKRSSNGDLMICSRPAVRRLKQGGANHPDRRPKSVVAHLRQGWQFRVDFERFEPEIIYFFQDGNLGANGDRYISQSQKPQIAQAATMFLHEEKRELMGKNGSPEQKRPDPRKGQGGSRTKRWVFVAIGASVDIENSNVS